MPAVAVTDTNNMFAALEFSVIAKDAGVQPIVGCQISLAYDPPRRAKSPARLRPSCCWRRPRPGYMNLMRLNSCLYIARAAPCRM